MEMTSISEYDVSYTLIATNCRVNAHISKGYKLTMHSKLGASHVKGTDWRMVADLLIVNRNTFDISLESLAKDWIEWLLHQQLKCWDSGEQS